MTSLRQQILSAEPGRLPPLLEDPEVGKRLAEQWECFEAFVQANPAAPIYAVTTLTGHRDREGVRLTPAAINRAIADSHYFPPTDDPDPRLWRLITLCKLTQLSWGGAPLRASLFEALRDGARSGAFVGRLDLRFSYSCGDVIPGCQWALQWLGALGEPVETLGPGEMIALINGGFVHLGSALWSMERLEVPLAREVSQSRRARDMLVRSGRYAEAQLPVSFRAMRQPHAAVRAMSDHAGAVIDRLLGAPSGNPLFHVGPPARFESQDSFMSCELGVIQSGLIEAILAMGWTITRRIQHLCEAYEDGGDADNPIALIQHPKMAESILQLMRLQNGARTFASGGATSEGIEDFWSRGTHLSLAITALADQLAQLLAIESQILTRIKPRP